MEYTLTARLTKGKLHVRAWSKLAQAIRRWRDGEYTITIARKHAHRSQRANKYYWGVVIALLSEHTGIDPDDLHLYLKARFLPKKLAVCDGNGSIVDECVLGGSTSQLNVVEFYDYVQRIKQWALESLGVEIPEPDSESVKAA